MKFLIVNSIIFLFSLLYSCDILSQVYPSIKELNLFFYDSNGERHKFNKVGEYPFFSKPIELDIEVCVNNFSSKYLVQISIEEKFIPNGDVILNDSIGSVLNSLKYSIGWCPHEVIYDGVLKNNIYLKNIKYKTAYYINPIFIIKEKFRINIVIYKRINGRINIISIYNKEFD